MPTLRRSPRLGFLTGWIVAVSLHSASAYALPTDGRVDVLREAGTPMGAIGLVVDMADKSRGTGLLVSPCHILTAGHVIEGETPEDVGGPFVFYLGQGDLGPDAGPGQPFAVSSPAHPIVWGGQYHERDKPGHHNMLPEAYKQGMDDWALLKLDRCLGDEGFGYLKLLPISTSEFTRTGRYAEAWLAGFPVNRETKKITIDPDCTLFGQIGYSGWDSDCIAMPGNSGGPLLAGNYTSSNPVDEWPRVLGIVITGSKDINVQFGAATIDAYLDARTTAVPTSAFVADIVPYLPKDPVVDSYLLAHPDPDRGYYLSAADLAVTDLTTAIANSGRSAPLLTRRGRWQAFSHHQEAAFADFSSALNMDPNFVPARRERALERVDQIIADGLTPERMAAALSDLDLVIQDFPADTRLRGERGHLYYRAYNYREALADLDIVVATDGDYPGNRRQRANARLELGNVEGALEDYNIALKSPFLTPETMLRRAIFYLRTGDAARAAADAEQVLTDWPDYRDAKLTRAVLFLDHGDIDAALQLMDRDMAGRGNDRDRALRASIRHVKGDLDDAIKDYQGVVSFNGSSRRDPPGSTADYDDTPVSTGEDPLLLYLAFAEAGETEEGNAVLRRMLEEGPTGTWSSTLARYLLGQYNETELQKAAGIGPEVLRKYQTFDLHFYLGAEAMMNGKADTARRHLEQVVATDMRQTVEFHLARRFLQDLGGPTYIVKN